MGTLICVSFVVGAFVVGVMLGRALAYFEMVRETSEWYDDD